VGYLVQNEEKRSSEKELGWIMSVGLGYERTEEAVFESKRS
jgi:hypothetical protein